MFRKHDLLLKSKCTFSGLINICLVLRNIFLHFTSLLGKSRTCIHLLGQFGKEYVPGIINITNNFYKNIFNSIIDMIKLSEAVCTNSFRIQAYGFIYPLQKKIQTNARKFQILILVCFRIICETVKIFGEILVSVEGWHWFLISVIVELALYFLVKALILTLN